MFVRLVPQPMTLETGFEPCACVSFCQHEHHDVPHVEPSKFEWFADTGAQRGFISSINNSIHWRLFGACAQTNARLDINQHPRRHGRGLRIYLLHSSSSYATVNDLMILERAIKPNRAMPAKLASAKRGFLTKAFRIL